MKTSNTSTVSVRKKTSQNDTSRLFLVLAATLSIYILASLLYEQNYIWSIGFIAFVLGTVRTYSWYKDLMNFDWSIELDEFSMGDVMADLENHSFKNVQPAKDIKEEKTKRIENPEFREELVFSPVLESI